MLAHGGLQNPNTIPPLKTRHRILPLSSHSIRSLPLPLPLPLPLSPSFRTPSSSCSGSLPRRFLSSYCPPDGSAPRGLSLSARTRGGSRSRRLHYICVGKLFSPGICSKFRAFPSVWGCRWVEGEGKVCAEHGAVGVDEKFLNLPNSVPISRMVSGPLIGWMIVREWYLPAFGTSIVSRATDWPDAFLARKMVQVLISCVALAMVGKDLLDHDPCSQSKSRFKMSLISGAVYKRASSLGWEWKSWYDILFWILNFSVDLFKLIGETTPNMAHLMVPENLSESIELRHFHGMLNQELHQRNQ
ncbi:unnamed protein product [Musa acuminata var. zebrina]